MGGTPNFVAQATLSIGWNSFHFRAKQFFLRNVLVNTRKQVSWHRCRQRVVKTHGAFHLTLIFEESGMFVTALGVQMGVCLQCLWMIRVILVQVVSFFLLSL